MRIQSAAARTTALAVVVSSFALTRPTSGSAVVAGYDVLEGDPRMRREIGFISHASYLYADLTAYENIRFYARMYHLEDPAGRALEVIEEVGLKDRRHDRVGTFSRGMVQRLSIARATVHNPSILFLDEPYTGLDRHASILLREHLKALHTEKRTVIMTTHDFPRGLEMCDRVAIQVKGRFVFVESIENIDRERFEESYLTAVAQALNPQRAS